MVLKLGARHSKHMFLRILFVVRHIGHPLFGGACLARGTREQQSRNQRERRKRHDNNRFMGTLRCPDQHPGTRLATRLWWGLRNTHVSKHFPVSVKKRKGKGMMIVATTETTKLTVKKEVSEFLSVQFCV